MVRGTAESSRKPANPKPHPLSQLYLAHSYATYCVNERLWTVYAHLCLDEVWLCHLVDAGRRGRMPCVSWYSLWWQPCSSCWMRSPRLTSLLRLIGWLQHWLLAAHTWMHSITLARHLGFKMQQQPSVPYWNLSQMTLQAWMTRYAAVQCTHTVS